MKRLLFLCSMLSLLAGCSYVDEMDQHTNGATTSGLHKTITAVVEDSDDADTDDMDTRTYVANDKDVLWQYNDAIAYFAKTTKAKYTYGGASGVTSAKFDLVEDTNNSRVLYTHAVYPYDAVTSCTHINETTQLSVVYPTEQTYVANSFGKGANLMVAKGATAMDADTDLVFRNACGYFTIKLYSSDKERAVKSIKLTALGGEKIAGAATIVVNDNGIPEITMSNEALSEITLNCGNGVALGADAESAVEFWFALPATTFESGIRIEAVDTEDETFVKETSKRIVVKRNRIQPMAALRFIGDRPLDNQLWYTRHTEGRTELYEFYGGENPFDATITDHYYDPEYKRFVVEFDAPLKVIKESAFTSFGVWDASKDIAMVALPRTVTTIEADAFIRSGITELVIPGSVTYIGEDALCYCPNLKSITFEPSPTNTPLKFEQSVNSGADHGPFGGEGYANIAVFEYININREIIHVKGNELYTPDGPGEGLFSTVSHTSKPTVIIIGEQVPEIYPFMFNGCGMETIEIPAHISKIGNGAFCKCKNLSSITIPATVKSIGTDAFYETHALKSVIIEDSDEPLQLGNTYGGLAGTIQRGAFYESPLTNIYLGRNIDYRDYDKPFTPDTWDEGVFACKNYEDETLETTVTISDNVTSLSRWMFSGVRMREVTIPASITSLASAVFAYCYILNQVTCEGVTPAELETSALFFQCSELNSIRVPSTAVEEYKTEWSRYESLIVGY